MYFSRSLYLFYHLRVCDFDVLKILVEEQGVGVDVDGRLLAALIIITTK